VETEVLEDSREHALEAAEPLAKLLLILER
jgi:hypothetical protein